MRGEIFGLVGESGSGKTTAGRLIVKLETPGLRKDPAERRGDLRASTEGRLKRYHRQVQMIFQDPYQSLNPQLSIYSSVVEPLLIHGISSGRDPPGTRAGDDSDRRTLSRPRPMPTGIPISSAGGQRQRVAIARAMVLEPDFVVADEPTSMLDASYSAQIFNIILDVRKRFGVTLLFITHSLAAARYLCDPHRRDLSGSCHGSGIGRRGDSPAPPSLHAGPDRRPAQIRTE